MPQPDRRLVSERLYTIAELIDLRRAMLRFSCSIPPRSERNQHLQIAISLRRLFQNKFWLDAHTIVDRR
jgi:hypothetical protein